MYARRILRHNLSIAISVLRSLLSRCLARLASCLSLAALPCRRRLFSLAASCSCLLFCPFYWLVWPVWLVPFWFFLFLFDVPVEAGRFRLLFGFVCRPVCWLGRSPLFLHRTAAIDFRSFRFCSCDFSSSASGGTAAWAQSLSRTPSRNRTRPLYPNSCSCYPLRWCRSCPRACLPAWFPTTVFVVN